MAKQLPAGNTCFRGKFAVLILRRGCQGRGTLAILVVTAALIGNTGSASAQNIFEALFGRFWNNSGPSAYADPNSQLRNPETRQDVGGLAYCVRLCDGRFFPIQRHAGVTPAQACSSFCPAAATKIYNGSSIDHAVAPDGKRYADLSTAFVYREKIVAGCTCNGKDAFGLVTTPIEEDTTLHPGDIVATNNGLLAYNGGNGRTASFTPVESYSALSSDLRRRLTETKIEPVTEPRKPQVVRQAEPAPRSRNNQRVQLDR
jgi:Protein of unknown function (DUF2865)